jgi:ABC-2 type transport system ATP-binding protein
VRIHRPFEAGAQAAPAAQRATAPVSVDTPQDPPATTPSAHTPPPASEPGVALGPGVTPGQRRGRGFANGRGLAGDAVVVANSVVKSFGDIVALGGVDLEVETGSVVGLLGRNGAGKSTLVRILATLAVPDAGTVHIGGLNAVRDARRVRSLIGLAGQYAAVDGTLTGRENLELVGRLYGLGRREARMRAQEVLERLSLTGAGDRMVLTYSGGMRRRLDLGASLVGHPVLLIMDEPTTGLDPGTRLELWRFIDDLVDEGTTVLLTTQYLEEADRLADRIALLERGKIIAEGSPNELKSRIGGDVLEVRATHRIDMPRLRTLLSGLGSGEPTVDLRSQRVTLPTGDPVDTLLAAAARIEQSDIAVEDLGLRRPSLDDVFLMLTGQQALANASTSAGGSPMGMLEPGA